MTEPARDITETEFDQRFTLVQFPDGGDTTDDRRVMQQYPENRVWSLVDNGDEEGGMSLVSGFAAVNFVAWQITEEEHPGQYMITVALDPIGDPDAQPEDPAQYNWISGEGS